MKAAQPSPQTSDLLMSLLNKRAVFRDSGILILVTVQEIRITPARLRVRLESYEELMPDSRIRSPSGRTFTVSGVWENVTVQQHLWSNVGQGCAWHIIPNQSAFEAVRRLCETESGLDAAMLFALADFVARHPARNESPIETREATARRIEFT